MPDKPKAKRVVLVHRAYEAPIAWQLYPVDQPISEDTYLAGFGEAYKARAYCIEQGFELVERGR